MNHESFINEVPNIIDMAKKKMGRVNILLVGKTGCGKSTLVNSVFGKDMVAVGVGSPVSMDFKEIRDIGNPDSCLGLFDSRGLELKEYESIINKLEEFVKDKANNPEPIEHIHIAWLCIEEGTRRIEEGEIRAAKMLAKYMPVIAVITKAQSDKSTEFKPQTGEKKEISFKETVSQHLPLAKEVVRVRAIETKYDEGYVLPAMGLNDLVEATYRLVPEAHKQAFIAAQQVNFEKKVSTSQLTVGGFAAAAAAAALVPANLTPPGGHSTLLVIEQTAMFASISGIFGLTVDEAFLATLITSTIGGSIATAAGHEIFRRLVELIPGAGVGVSAAVGAGTASTITTIMGMAYIATLEAILKDNPNPSPDQIAEAFKEELRRKNFNP